MDEIWVALRRARLENSVKFSAPAGRTSKHSVTAVIVAIVAFRFQIFVPLVFFTRLLFLPLRLRPVRKSAPQRNNGNYFTRSFTKPQRQKDATSETRPPLGKFSHFKI